MSSVSALCTPAFLIDRDTLQRNCARMLESAAKHACRIRPHLKTHKSAAIGLLQCGVRNASEAACCVSTLHEAHYFLEQGFGDVLYAVPIAGEAKLLRAKQLRDAHGAKLSFLLDTLEGAQCMAEFIAKHCAHATWDVFVFGDTGYHREGVSGTAFKQLVAFVRARESVFRVRGFYTHAGHSYRIADGVPLEQRAKDEATLLLKEVNEAGGARPGELLSVGSTPTASALHKLSGELSGITEIHPGNYVFNDVQQAQIGSCKIEDIACCVLCTVVAVYPDRNNAVVDVGSRGLGKDILEQPSDSPWGVVVGHPELHLVSISQEHGVLKCADRGKLDAIKVGQHLRILPNHSCLTATNFDEYFIVDGDEIVSRVVPCSRGF